jgi:hypothetical protein
MAARAAMAVLVTVATAVAACGTCGVGGRRLIFGMATDSRASRSGMERIQLLVPFDFPDIFFAIIDSIIGSITGSIIGSIIGNILATAAFANRIFCGTYTCEAAYLIFIFDSRCCS